MACASREWRLSRFSPRVGVDNEPRQGLKPARHMPHATCHISPFRFRAVKRPARRPGESLLGSGNGLGLGLGLWELVSHSSFGTGSRYSTCAVTYRYCMLLVLIICSIIIFCYFYYFYHFCYFCCFCCLIVLFPIIFVAYPY